MKPHFILMGILLLLVIVFFFPKPAGSACGFCGPNPSIQRIELECIGFRSDIPPPEGWLDAGPSLVCFGWVTGKKTCYTSVFASRQEWKEVSCTR
jgi:hypothetical protein